MRLSRASYLFSCMYLLFTTDEQKGFCFQARQNVFTSETVRLYDHSLLAMSAKIVAAFGADSI